MNRAPTLATIEHPSAARLGGKAAALVRLHALGVPVPEGFVLGREHFDRFVRENTLDQLSARQRLDLEDPSSFEAAAAIMARAVERAAIPADTRAELRAAWDPGGPDAYIVRSSAVGEDSETDSYAGQLDSVLDVRSAEQLEDAVRHCWGSYWSARALFYQHARGRRLRGMGVIVERMIDAAMGGVLFSRSPNDADAIAIEYVAGHPGELVAGKVEPERMLVPRDSPPAAAPFAELVMIGLELERALGRPQDVEWVVDHAGKLWIVQSRAITTPSASRQLFSNVNVNENYPRPISPLLYSIASEAYEHYFRSLGRALGVREAVLEGIEQPLRHCVGVHGARLYYNLSNIHRAIAAAPFGRPLEAAFDDFVGVDDERGDHLHGLAPTRTRWRDVVRVAWFGLRSLRSIPRRLARFEARVDAYAARTEALERQSIAQLHARLLEFLDIRLHRWGDAALADLGATLAYAWLRWTLRKTLGTEAAKQLPQALLLAARGEGPRVASRRDFRRGVGAETPLYRAYCKFRGHSPRRKDQARRREDLHHGLLAVPKVEHVSTGPIAGVWGLSRIALADPVLRDAFARLATEDPERLLASIRADPRHREFCVAFDDYLRSWGFRVSGELLLTTESFVERPATLLPVIAPYLEIDGPSPEASTVIQEARRDEAIAEAHRRLRPAWRWVFDRALRATQRAISDRERARLRQALLYCRLRMVVRELGRKLGSRGRLRRDDDLLFLTWREIDEWLSGHAMFPAVLADLVELRRREHARLSEQHPPDNVRLPVGEYLRGPEASPKVADTEILEGVGVAGGRVIGVARIIEDLAEAGSFERGDCLVTRQTDPGWAPLFFLAKGLVMERGGMLSHGAIVARELGIPGVIAVPDATRILRSGERIEIDGDHGLVRRLGDSATRRLGGGVGGE